MRDYILKCDLSEGIQKQVIGLVRDYDNMKRQYDSIIGSSSQVLDGQPRGSNNGDPTSRNALVRAELFRKLQAVEQALLAIDAPYRRGVWDKIAYSMSYPEDAHRSTYSRKRKEFMYRVARNMYWI